MLMELFHGAEVVFHLAAEPRLPLSIEDPIGTHEVNVTGTLNVFEGARQQKVKKVIFSSSAAVYADFSLPAEEGIITNPESPYGLHKYMGEEYAHLYYELFGLSTVCLRYFNVFGSRKTADGGYPMVIPFFLKQRSEKKLLTIVGDGKQTRDYVHVSDVVRANILAWKSDVVDGMPINIGSGVQVSVNEIAKMIGGDTTFIPQRPGEMRFVQANIDRAKRLLHWEPTMDFVEGIKELKKEWKID